MNFPFKKSSPQLNPVKVTLEGPLVRAVVTNAGRVCAVVHVSASLSKRLVCFDSDGTRRWQHDLEVGPHSYGSLSLRVASDGVLWLGLDDQLLAFDDDGRQIKVMPLELEPGESAGSFLPRPDGFIVSIYRSKYETDDGLPADLTSRVVCVDLDGKPRWATTFPLELHQFAGIVEARADADWKIQAKPAWRPRTWSSDRYVRDPLLLSGNRLLTSYIDISSGVGVSYCLDVNTGNLQWQTPTLPFSRRAIGGHEKFLLSVGGYGMSLTQLRDGDGAILRDWDRNGVMCVRPSGEVVVIEDFDEPPHVWELSLSKAPRKGPGVPGTHSTALVLTNEGQVLFWRAGSLCCVGRDLQLNVLYSSPERKDYWPTNSMLLCPDGTVVFGINPGQAGISELWFVRTDFALEDKSPWPCADGNMTANPCWPSGLATV